MLLVCGVCSIRVFYYSFNVQIKECKFAGFIAILIVNVASQNVKTEICTFVS